MLLIELATIFSLWVVVLLVMVMVAYMQVCTVVLCNTWCAASTGAHPIVLCIPNCHVQMTTVHMCSFCPCFVHFSNMLYYC